MYLFMLFTYLNPQQVEYVFEKETHLVHPNLQGFDLWLQDSRTEELEDRSSQIMWNQENVDRSKSCTLEGDISRDFANETNRLQYLYSSSPIKRGVQENIVTTTLYDMSPDGQFRTCKGVSHTMSNLWNLLSHLGVLSLCINPYLLINLRVLYEY